MGVDAVVIGSIAAVVLTILVIAITGYKIVKNIEDSERSDDTDK